MNFFTLSAGASLHNKPAPVNNSLMNGLTCRTITRIGLALLVALTTITVQAAPKNLTAVLQQANASIKGKVSDSKGIAIPGATVKVAGPVNQTTTTDANGNYTITGLRAGSYTVTYGFLGFSETGKTIILTNGQQNVSDIALTESANDLDEVVVVGYGTTQRKGNITSSISTISGESIKNVPVAALSNALGGALPGVITRQTTGQPGSDGATITIRGVATTGGSGPLTIVDGIPRPFDSLDPNTIETFTVLKDAAAVAIYGIGGSNGVILVTTKRGKTGTPALSFSTFTGIQNPVVTPEYPTSFEFASLQNAAAYNDYLAAGSVGLYKPTWTDAQLALFQDGTIDKDRYPNVDGIDYFIDKNNIETTNNVEISGGTDKVKYYGSLGYMYQKGIFRNVNHVNRFNVAMNMDAQVTNTTKVSMSINGRNQTTQNSPVATSRIFELIKYILPIYPVFYSNGGNSTYLYGDIYESGYNTLKRTEIFTTLALEQRLPFIAGLSAKASVSYDPRIDFSKAWRVPVHQWSANFNTTPYTFTDGIFEQTKPSLTSSMDQRYNLTYQGQLNYNRTFGSHSVGIVGGGEAKGFQSNNVSGTRNNFNLYTDELGLGSSVATDASNNGGNSQSRTLSVFYSANYAFKNKYLFQATGRYDGSYQYAPGKRFGFFPAFSAGWVVSDENFMKNISFLNRFKIFGSWGLTGKDAGSAYAYLSSYGVNSNAYIFNGAAQQSLSERSEPNPDQTWEKRQGVNVGFDSDFWKGLFTLKAEYFYVYTANMQATPDVVLPAEYGIGVASINAGKMQNQGIEISVGSNHRFNKNLSAGISGNLTFARNKLLQTFESAATLNSYNGYARRTGRPLNTVFGYHALGYYTNDDFVDPKLATPVLKAGIPTPPNSPVRPGDLRYFDANQDGKITSLDQMAIGRPINPGPETIWGITPNVNYKAFSLSFLLQGNGNADFNLTAWGIQPFDAGRGANENNRDYWTVDNPNARFPRITSSTFAGNTTLSDWWIFDAQYVRLKNVQLTYSLPTNFIKRLGMSRAAVSLTGQNVHTWTNMPYWDVEGNSSQGGWPSSQVLSMGLNVTF